MTPEPVRVSIVTPFLNPGRFFVEAIESVLAQTFTAWELLLTDDGSSDGSRDVAQAYAASHPERIRYLAHAGGAHKGASASRNLATKAARGELVAFLDADDVYLPTKLEEQVALLDARPEAGWLYGGTQYWHGWTGEPEDQARDWVWRNFGVEANACVEPPRMLASFLRQPGTVPCMGSVLARRTAIEAMGGWEDTFTHICTDQVFHAKLALRVPVFIADGCWDRYRQHPASACSRAGRAGELDAAMMRYRRWLERYLLQQGVTDHDVWSALRQALEPPGHSWRHRLQAQVSAVAAVARRGVGWR